MTEYVLAYHGGGRPETPEQGAKQMADWRAWMGGLGDALVDGGKPVGMSKTISSSGVADNGGPNPLSGFSVIQADTMDAAIELAKGCPLIAMGGSIEIAEAMNMDM